MSINAYEVSYEAPGVRSYGETVIVKVKEYDNQEDIKKKIRDIIALRQDVRTDRIEKLEYGSISLEEVRIKDLTAADLLRLIGKD